MKKLSLIAIAFATGISCDTEVDPKPPPLPEVEIIVKPSADIVKEGSNDKVEVTVRLSILPAKYTFLHFQGDSKFCAICNVSAGSLFNWRFLEGETEKTVILQITDNATYEIGGLVSLELTSIEVPYGPEPPGQDVSDRNLSIDFNYENNDPKPVIGFEPFNGIETTTMNETTPLEISEYINLSAGARNDYSVQLDFSGTAKAGEDYQILAPDTVKIKGDISKSKTQVKLFKIINDNVAEGDPATSDFPSDNEYIDISIKPLDHATLGNTSNSTKLRATIRYYILDSEDN